MFEPSTTKDEFVSAYTNKLDTDMDTDRNGLTRGHWSVGLFSCSDCIPNGFMSLVCPGVSIAQISSRLGLIRYKLVLQLYALLYLLVLLTIIGDTAVLKFLCVVAAIAATLAVARLRTKIRGLFEIPGNDLLDVASVVACAPCSIAQMATHTQAYEAGTCSFRARSTLEGYVRQ